MYSFALTKPPPVTLGEADKLIKILREKNELVLGKCAGEDKQCLPLKGGEGSGSAKNLMTSVRVVNGKVISKPQPEYPPIAKAARAQETDHRRKKGRRDKTELGTGFIRIQGCAKEVFIISLT